MNIYVREIGQGKLLAQPDLDSAKLTVEDNIGESIHIHIRNTRLEFTVAEFMEFAECIEDAGEEIDNGDY